MKLDNPTYQFVTIYSSIAQCLKLGCFHGPSPAAVWTPGVIEAVVGMVEAGHSTTGLRCPSFGLLTNDTSHHGPRMPLRLLL